MLGRVKGIIFSLLSGMLRILHINGKKRTVPKSDSDTRARCSFEFARFCSGGEDLASSAGRSQETHQGDVHRATGYVIGVFCLAGEFEM